MRKLSGPRTPAERGKVRTTFDLKPQTLDLLRAAAERMGIPQVMVMELMIRRYCTPEHEKKRARENDELF